MCIEEVSPPKPPVQGSLILIHVDVIVDSTTEMEKREEKADGETQFRIHVLPKGNE